MGDTMVARVRVSLLVALLGVLSGCQLIFDDPCGIGTRLEGEPTPPPECVE
jgi:hypothetical protein